MITCYKEVGVKGDTLDRGKVIGVTGWWGGGQG